MVPNHNPNLPPPSQTKNLPLSDVVKIEGI